MSAAIEKYVDVATLIRSEKPVNPVYCIYPHIYSEVAGEFLQGFPGRVLYAVKANPNPYIIKLLIDSGIQHFDYGFISLSILECLYYCIDNSGNFFFHENVWQFFGRLRTG